MTFPRHRARKWKTIYCFPSSCTVCCCKWSRNCIWRIWISISCYYWFAIIHLLFHLWVLFW